MAEHHPNCGNMSVPDVLYRCELCGRDMDWCGCRYRCRKCEPDTETKPLTADPMRDRIAAAVLPVNRCWNCGTDDQACKRCQSIALQTADAVIAELALELDDEEPPWQPTGWHRYITKWERNE